jgi:hypothetical protein
MRELRVAVACPGLGLGQRPIFNALVLPAALHAGGHLRWALLSRTGTGGGREQKKKAAEGCSWTMLGHEFLLCVPCGTLQLQVASLSGMSGPSLA